MLIIGWEVKSLPQSDEKEKKYLQSGARKKSEKDEYPISCIATFISSYRINFQNFG